MSGKSAGVGWQKRNQIIPPDPDLPNQTGVWQILRFLTPSDPFFFFHVLAVHLNKAWDKNCAKGASLSGN